LIAADTGEIINPPLAVHEVAEGGIGMSPCNGLENLTQGGQGADRCGSESDRGGEDKFHGHLQR